MKFKCAVIGLGRIGCGFDDVVDGKVKTHVGAYLKTPKTRLVALCDVDKSKLNKYGTKYNIISLFTDYRQLLEETELDIISICTHANSHLEIVKEAAKNNIKGIFLEKPISNNLIDAKKILQICDKNNIVLQIDHQRRFSYFYKYLKEIMHKKKFGKIYHVHIYYGAGIVNTGTHVLDLIRFFYGNITAVKGQFSQINSGIKNDPNINGVIMCKNQIICNLQALEIKKFRILEFDIIAENARLRIDLAKDTAELSIINPKKTDLVYRDVRKQIICTKEPKEKIVEGLDDLVRAITKNSEVLCTGFDGLSSLKAALFLIKSAKNNGQTIHLSTKG